jgi:hypothetical protein
MRAKHILAFIIFGSLNLGAADAPAKEELTAAAKKLADQPNYSWRSTVVVPETAQFKPGPTEGKTEKDGFTYVTMSFGDNKSEMVIKGDKAVALTQEDGWKLATDLENSEGRGRFLGRLARNFKTPAAQALELLGYLKELKKEGDLYSGELTEEGAKKQFRFGQAQNPKGNARFWVKDGMLTKMEVKIEGRIEFNGNDFDASRATTTEIKDVGTTKVNPPAEATKKLS